MNFQHHPEFQTHFAKVKTGSNFFEVCGQPCLARDLHYATLGDYPWRTLSTIAVSVEEMSPTQAIIVLPLLLSAALRLPESENTSCHLSFYSLHLSCPNDTQEAFKQLHRLNVDQLAALSRLIIEFVTDEILYESSSTGPLLMINRMTALDKRSATPKHIENTRYLI